MDSSQISQMANFAKDHCTKGECYKREFNYLNSNIKSF